nr:zinc finger, CCHC-type [Tanacetum cinerariifolium]
MIEPNKKTEADNKKDKTVIAFLYQALPEHQLLQITKHKTAKSIWNALKTRHIGEERVQQARLQTLKSEFEMLHMKEDETIDAFTTKLTTLVNKAASLGHTMEDETLVRKLLNAVPDRMISLADMIKEGNWKWPSEWRNNDFETSNTRQDHGMRDLYWLVMAIVHEGRFSIVKGNWPGWVGYDDWNSES